MKKIKWNTAFAKTKVEQVKKNPSLKTILVVVLFLILGFLNVAQSLTVVQLQYKTADLKEKMFDYQNENKVLTEKIEKIDTDQYIEEKARKKLSMVKSGETPVKIYEKEEKQNESKGYLEPKEKVGIYMKDWYEKLEDWFSLLKNN